MSSNAKGSGGGGGGGKGKSVGKGKGKEDGQKDPGGNEAITAAKKQKPKPKPTFGFGGSATSTFSAAFPSTAPDAKLKLNNDLCEACGKGDLKEVKRLLSEKADANARVDGDDNKQCALHRACCKDNVEIAEVLLAHGADIDAKSYKGYTSLHFACMLGLKEMIIFLISKGASLKGIIFILLKSHMSVEITKSKFFSYTTETQHLGRTALHVACLANVNATNCSLGKAICEVLIVNGSSLTVETINFKDTPLQCACWKGYEELSTFLASKGADIYCKDSAGLSPYDYAKKHNFSDKLRRARPWMARCFDVCGTLFAYCLDEFEKLPEEVEAALKKRVDDLKSEVVEKVADL